ncbi:EamA family transporter [Terriglobus albidus]|uniref:EamA family transporter n=1 Tax=Terriglobus albidus TaxID=1592106 RepID=UPI001FECE470|nr:EamA family transporter [Terriglobus albidus]
MTIWTVVVFATAGDILIAGAMRRLGDLDEIRAKSGLGGAIKAVVTSPFLVAGIGCMAVSFFALLYALSVADLSLIAPATASLTYIATSVSARIFLKEQVDKRRWIAALFVGAGVLLLER